MSLAEMEVWRDELLWLEKAMQEDPDVHRIADCFAQLCRRLREHVEEDIATGRSRQ